MKRIALLLLLATGSFAQQPESWTRPVDPVRVAGNIYYIGTEDLGAYLIVGKEGSILLDAPLDENVELLLSNVKKLGRDPKTIRILLNSHAHVDHIGGFARMKKETGAKIYLSAADAELALRGGVGDFAFGDRFEYPPVTADVIVKDGDTIRLGDITMTAVLTPGHTKGCTTWRTTVTEKGKPLDVIFLCSVTAPGYTLVDNEKYPQILDDYRHTFATLRAMRADVFLANHGSFFHLAQKLAKVKKGGANPFIDAAEFPAFVERSEKAIEEQARK